MPDIGALLTDFGPLVRDLTSHQYLPAIALVSSYLVMLLGRDSRFPISLPASWDTDRWKPVAVLVACEVQSVALAILPVSAGGSGMDLAHATVLALKAAMWSYGLWALVAKAVYKGNLPKWMLWVSMALPEPQPLPPNPAVPVVDLSKLPMIPPAKDPPSPPPAA